MMVHSQILPLRVLVITQPLASANNGEIIYRETVNLPATLLNINGVITNATPSSVFSFDAAGINDSGVMVGSAQALDDSYYGVATVDTTTLTVTHIAVPYDVNVSVYGYAYATGINNSGIIIGEYEDASGHHGFVDNGGTFSTVDDPHGIGATYVTSINDNGVVRRGIIRTFFPASIMALSTRTEYFLP